jgi:AcrR family transcriptional regulator
MTGSTDVLVLEDPAGTRLVVDAALRVVARIGVAKLTLEDVAREAGISRATLYRRFPGKPALLEAVVASEADRLRRGIDEALADVSTLPDALMASAAFGAREFAGHPALQFLLAHEPGAVLPALCFDGAERVLSAMAGCIEGHLCRFLPRLQARRTGEWLGRIVLSYGCTPPLESPGGSAEATVLAVVRDFVVPALSAEVPDAC